MVGIFARLLVIGLLTVPLVASSAGEPAQSLEKSLREALKVPPDAPVGYATADGTLLTEAEFMAELQRAPANVVADLELHPGKTIFRLQKPETSPPDADPSVLPTLDHTSLDGRRVRNADLAGRPTLLSFFFSTCVPCIKEVPALNEFRRRNPGLNYLAITFDDDVEARAFVTQRKLDWPVIAAAKPFIDSAGVKNYPAYLLVAADGRIVARHTGLKLGGEEDKPGLASLESWVAEARKSL